MSAVEPVGACHCWDFLARLCCGPKDAEDDTPTAELAKKKLEEQRKREAAFKPGHGKHFSQDVLTDKDMIRWGNYLSSQLK